LGCKLVKQALATNPAEIWFYAALQQALCCAAAMRKKMEQAIVCSRPFVVGRRCPPVAAQNSKSSISRENFLFFEKFSLISANVEPV